MSRNLDALYDMKYKFAILAVLCLLIVLIMGMDMAKYPDGKPDNVDDPLYTFSAFVILPLFIIVAVLAVAWTWEFIFKSNHSLVVSRAKKGADIATLIACLEDPDVITRSEAAKALVELHDPDSPGFIEAFARAAKDSDKGVRLAAVRALGDSGDLKAVPVLADAMCDEDRDVREIAAVELQKVKTKAAASEPTHADHVGPGAHLPQPVTVKEVIVREIVKVPCQYCGTLVEVTAAKCPSCGAPKSK